MVEQEVQSLPTVDKSLRRRRSLLEFLGALVCMATVSEITDTEKNVDSR